MRAIGKTKEAQEFMREFTDWSEKQPGEQAEP